MTNENEVSNSILQIRVKRPLKEQNNNGIPDEEAADSVWADYKKSNKSIIVTSFAGQHKSSLVCMSCNKESVIFEPFFNLSLPIPSSKTQCSIMVRLTYFHLAVVHVVIRKYVVVTAVSRRNASNFTLNRNKSAVGLARSAKITREPLKKSTFGSCRRFWWSTSKGISR